MTIRDTSTEAGAPAAPIAPDATASAYARAAALTPRGAGTGTRRSPTGGG